MQDLTLVLVLPSATGGMMLQLMVSTIDDRAQDLTLFLLDSRHRFTPAHPESYSSVFTNDISVRQRQRYRVKYSKQSPLNSAHAQNRETKRCFVAGRRKKQGILFL